MQNKTKLLLAAGLALLPLAVLAQPGIPALTTSAAPGGGTQYSLPVQTLLLMTAFSFLPAALLAAGFVGINTRLYALLLRRGGLRAVVAGFGLHVLHSLIALVAAPAGLLAFVFSRRLKARPPRPLPQAADR